MTREEALKKVRQMSLPKETMEILEALAPELKESEDERIRKALIWHLKADVDFVSNGVTKAECIAYLEKQKEQIPYIDFVIKPHKGDDNNPYDMQVSEAQEYAIKRGFGIPYNDGEVYVDERHMTQTIGNILRWADEHPKEQKPWKVGANAYFTPEQKPAEKHDLVAQLREHLANATKEQLEAEWKELEKWNDVGPTVEEYLGGIKPAEWSKEDEEMLQSIIKDFRAGKVSTIGQEQWLKSLPERFNLQPKQVWSEEDEDFINMLILHFNYLIDKGGDSVETYKSYIEKLKSLRPRLSDEEIKKIRSEEYTKGFNDAAFGGKLKEWSEEDKKMLKAIDLSLDCYSEGQCPALVMQISREREWLNSLSLNLKKKNEDVAKLCSNEWSDDVKEKISLMIAYFEGKARSNDTSEPDKRVFGRWANILASLCLQPKQEWSEEDEKMWNLVWDILDGPFKASKEGYKKAANWFIKKCPKGFKHQSHWKPSEEQMNGLAHAINLDVYDAKRYGLDSLYSDLKKLM